MEKVLIFYSEIGLKGYNKKDFEKKLKSNIQMHSNKAALKLNIIKKKGNHYFCIFDDSREDITKVLKNIFGIKSFSFVEELGKDINKFLDRINEIILDFKKKKIKETNIKTKRSDKNFEKTSVELNAIIGDIAKKNGIKINFKSNQNILYVRINMKNIYIYHERILGLDGLPTGSSGKVLVLLSGGIDSPVAAYKIMKRGVECDFLHFHSFKENKEVLNSKIVNTIRILNKYQIKSKLYCIPYYLFDFVVSQNLYDNYSLIFFKNYILTIADKITKEYKYDAIVTGDALSQVASQTIENINTTSYNIKSQILRPLISYDKQEIINIAENIGSLDISNQHYKDCCSLVAKNPITKSRVEKYEKTIRNIDLDELYKKSLEKIEVFNI